MDISMRRLFRRPSEERSNVYFTYGKRCLDIASALTACFVFLPVVVFIPLLIKALDPGPVIFRQTRIGKNGTSFEIYKFRSMPVNTRSVASDQLEEVRLTWIGRFIRRTNLDELPQFFNIIKGDMSLVGPRPSIEAQRELIELRRESGALSCRPGLTGLAQICSFDGMPTSEKARLDAEYARSISFFGDVKIIIATFDYLRRPPPTY